MREIFISSKFKKFLVAVIALVCLICFTGCSAGVDVYEYTKDNLLHTEIQVKVDSTLSDVLDSSGTLIYPDTTFKDTWTMREWLSRYFTQLTYDRDMTVSYLGSKTVDKTNYYAFDAVFDLNGNMGEKLATDVSNTKKDSLFFRNYSGVKQSRFNVFQQQYSEVAQRKASNAQTINDYSSEMGIIINGKRNYYPGMNKPEHADGEFIYDSRFKMCYVQFIPPIDEAFPAINMATANGFNLDSFWKGSTRMKVSADNKIELKQKQAYFYFHKTLGDTATTFDYAFKRAISYHWFILAAILGGITTGGIILFCYLKKRHDNKPEPPKVTDLFPYDPFS